MPALSPRLPAFQLRRLVSVEPCCFGALWQDEAVVTGPSRPAEPLEPALQLFSERSAGLVRGGGSPERWEIHRRGLQQQVCPGFGRDKGSRNVCGNVI